MNKAYAICILLLAGTLAGCAEAIPDPPLVVEGANAPDWEYLNGTYTYMVDDNNSTVPVVTLGNESTWLQVNSYTLNATHMSFVTEDNAITFNNKSFTLSGYLNQEGVLWDSGYAPLMGNNTLHFPTFPYDITVEYSVMYREWTGME
tara:strand:- start:882 stop:1322 length:441 start_codon:yes stop_codon:yes gene_type:complete